MQVGNRLTHNHHSLYRLSPLRVRHAEYGYFYHVRVSLQRNFNLAWIDVYTAGND